VLRVDIDADGTMYRFVDEVARLLNESHGTNIDAKDCTHWDWYRDYGISRSAFYKACDAVHVDGHVGRLKPYDGLTIPVLHAMDRHRDIWPHVLTGKDSRNHDLIHEWLIVNDGPELPIRQPPAGQTHINGIHGKLEYPWHVLIDDHPGLVREFLDAGGDRDMGVLVSIKAPWNAEAQSEVPKNHPNIRCVGDWMGVWVVVYTILNQP